MPNAFTLLDLEQGSEQWLGWRRGGIGASDAPAIMGENPWKSAADLLVERRNPRVKERGRMSRAIVRGNLLEPKARDAYNSMRGLDVQPLCLQSNEHEWMRASLDGLCLETMQAVEIKCGEATYKRSARSLKVPDYYYGQLQHTLAVTGLSQMDYFGFLPNRPPILINVPRDEAYIARLITQEAAFWEEANRS